MDKLISFETSVHLDELHCNLSCNYYYNADGEVLYKSEWGQAPITGYAAPSIASTLEQLKSQGVDSDDISNVVKLVLLKYLTNNYSIDKTYWVESCLSCSKDKSIISNLINSTIAGEKLVVLNSELIDESHESCIQQMILDQFSETNSYVFDQFKINIGAALGKSVIIITDDIVKSIIM